MRGTSFASPTSSTQRALGLVLQITPLPIPLGECVEGAESPEQLFENLVATAKGAGYRGLAVAEGSNSPDFLSFQSPRLVQTLHSISAELAALSLVKLPS